MMCSRTLQQINVRDIGRLLDGNLRSPFLKTGATIACFHSDGR